MPKFADRLSFNLEQLGLPIECYRKGWVMDNHTKRRRWRLVSLFGLILVAAGACQSNGREGVDVSQQARAEIQALLDARVDDADFILSAYDYNILREDYLATCMANEGFKYQPFVPESFEQSDVQATSTPDRAYAERFGLGMLPLLETTVAAPPPTPNPNDDYRAGLSEFERAAYDEIIGACAAKSQQDLGAPPGTLTMSAEADLLVTETEERASASPDYLSALADWSPCMGNSGFSFRDRADMFLQLGETAEEFAAPLVEAVNERYAADDQIGARNLRMVDVLIPSEFTRYEDAIAEEIDVALADVVCGLPVVEAYRESYLLELEELTQG